MKPLFTIVRTQANLFDKNATLYMKALLKEAKARHENVSIMIANSQEEFDTYMNMSKPILVLEPCEFVGTPRYNLELGQTARVCRDFILENVPAPADVVIINRSHLIGRTLCNLLLDCDYTVTVCHSKTTGLFGKCMSADAIITATGQDMDNCVPLNHKCVVDVSDDISYRSTKPLNYLDMATIGKRTTELLFQDAVEMQNDLEAVG